MERFEVCNYNKVFFNLYDEEQARVEAKKLSEERNERIAIIGITDTVFAESTRFITAYVQGAEESEMIFFVSVAKYKKEADKKVSFFQKEGIPVVTKPHKKFGWLISTSRDYHLKAVELYDQNCRVENVLTKQIVRKGAWE